MEWRRKRDSNPRLSFPNNGFQDRRLQPLGHSSIPNLSPKGLESQSHLNCGLAARRQRCAGEQTAEVDHVEAIRHIAHVELES